MLGVTREREKNSVNCKIALARTRKDIRRFAHCTKSVTISKLQNVLNQKSDTWLLFNVNWLRWCLRRRRSLTMQHAARKGAKQTNETKSPIVALYGLLNLIGLLCFSRWMVSPIHSPWQPTAASNAWCARVSSSWQKIKMTRRKRRDTHNYPNKLMYLRSTIETR